MTGHKQKALMMAMAVEAQTSETPWDIFEREHAATGEWAKCRSEPNWDSSSTYRLKPKTQVIDWSKVNYDIVPVKDPSTHATYYSEGKADVMLYTGATLVTDKKIVWAGGECPLPEGVMVTVRMRCGDLMSLPATQLVWGRDTQILWFEVTGLADGYSWGEG